MGDIHSKTAKALFGEATPPRRGQAMAINFACIYGRSPTNMSKEAMVRLIKHRDSCHDDWGEDGAWRTLCGLRTMEADRFPEDLHDALKEFQALDEEAQYSLVYETLGITPETSFQVLPTGHTEEQLRAALRLLGLQVYERPGKLILSRVELDAADIAEIEGQVIE